MSLRTELLSGVFFTAVSKYANIVVSLLVTAVLSRLLVPEQFGVVALATVVISFLTIFADVGLTATIIQYKDLKKEELNSLFSLSFYFALILSLLVFVSAGYLAKYYNEVLLQPVCQWLAVNLFFTTIAVVPNAMFYREKLFKQIAIRTSIVQLVGGSLAVLWAIMYAEVYALVVGPVLSSILLFFISYRRFPLHFKARFSLHSIAHTFSYSLYQFLFNIINFFSRNMDTLVIGKVLGPSVLGYYDKAYRLMSLPLQNITQVITPVLHPLLSGRSTERDYLMRSNESMGKILALIGFPMSIWLYFVAEELILLFFGPQWHAAVPAFSLLSLTVGIQLVLSSSGSFFQAAGDTRSLFICGVFSAILNVGVILWGTFYYRSIEAVALGLLFSFAVNFIQAYWLLYRKVFQANSLRFFKLMLKPLLFSMLLALCYVMLRAVIKIEGTFINFGWKTAVYGLSMLLFVFFGGYKTEIMQLIKRKKN